MLDHELARPVVREELALAFTDCEKPESEFRIGAEGEKFGVHHETGAPLGYGQAFGVCQVMEQLAKEHGWSAYREFEGAPVIALERAHASITLEPSAQLELSGAPLADLHATAAELGAHFAEIRAVSERLGIAWLTTGFHPLARLEELPWIPKSRYPIMRRYLPEKGKRGLDMMQRTCTVQGNFDWSSERDAMQKLRLGLRVAPILNALFANSPFLEGRVGERLSERGDVWLNMDPARSGLVPRVFDRVDAGYEEYIEWALDAGMFLIKRKDRIVENTGQTFRDFLQNGFEGERATLSDFKLHLATLFPEVRLKNTLEFRSLDCLPPALTLGALALVTGLFYDQRALDAASALTAHFTSEALRSCRPELTTRGLSAPIPGAMDGWRMAEQLVELAAAGLERRARRDAAGSSEAVFLGPVRELLERRESPAARALAAYRRSGSLIAATHLDLAAPFRHW